MQQLINFLSKRKYIFLFILIQLITLWLTIQNKDYHRAKFINSTGDFIGSIYSSINNFDKYIDLYEDNQNLLEENAKLQSMLKSSMVEVGISMKEHTDTNNLRIVQKYNFTSAEIINNSYRRRNNHITINKGTRNGVEDGDGVITSNGIIGVIESTGEKYSSIISVLNKNLLVNAKLKNSNYLVTIGDTIITGGYSTIFPEGITIGTIKNIEIQENQNYYEIIVSPFLDYANIKAVYIINNLHREEIKSLEK